MAMQLVAVWAAMEGLLVLSGEGIVHSAGFLSLDARITTYVVAHRTPWLDDFMKGMTWAGSWVALTTLAIVVAVLVWQRRLRLAAVVTMLAAWLGAAAAVSLTKFVVHRARPPKGCGW